MPARVAGTWQLDAGLPSGRHSYELDVRQDHQKIAGGVRTGGAGFLPLFDPRLEGERIRFVLVDEGQAHHFEGRVRGRVMEGRVRSGIGKDLTEQTWRAERAGR